MSRTEALEELENRPDAERIFVVALDDALFTMVPTPRWFMAGDVTIAFVPASAFEDPAHQADLWVGAYVPSAPGRKLFFQTLSGALYEFDPQGRVFRNGVLLSTGPVIDFGVLATRERGRIQVGERAALLLKEDQDCDEGGAWARLTTPVLVVAHFPAIDPLRRPRTDEWLRHAAAIICR